MSNSKGRRNFIKNSLLSIGGGFLAPNIISCATDIQDFDQPITVFQNANNSNFDYGVASFDPTDSQVIIWTRYTSLLNEVPLQWQVATNPNFSTIIRYGDVVTSQDRDYTISIEVQDLEENQTLYYRFIDHIHKNVSISGETKTFSKSEIERLKIGVASCSNYEMGYFNVYKEMANSDIDIVIHLGDYIYENSVSDSNDSTNSLDRGHIPTNEPYTLDDYRSRYKQYRTDPDLLLLHQKKPFICVWDDHEISNDAYKGGAGGHQENEGDFELRKQIALQVYSEYLPFKSNNESIIYRSFNFGNLVQLTMLDTRLAGRDKQLNISDYFDTNNTFDTDLFASDWLNSSRSILGATQKRWLSDTVNSSSSEWQLIGQQVLMGKMYFPIELVSLLNEIQIENSVTGTISEESKIKMKSQLFDLVEIKLRLKVNDPTLTEFEKSRVLNTIPFNLDSWDGYPVEREEVLSLLETKKTIVLAGDSHNAWYNKIQADTSSKIVNELATAAVTTSGFEGIITDSELRQDFQTAITTLVDQLDYFESSKKGYIELTISSGMATSEWISVDTVLNKNYNSNTEKTLLL